MREEGGVRNRVLQLIVSSALVMLLGATGTAMAAFPGANGKIAYAEDSGPTGSSDIVASDPSGAGKVPLRSTAQDETDPAYSADGEKIAYVHTFGGSTGQIWVMNANGSNPVQLTTSSATTTDGAPAFTRSGQIVFARTDTGTGNTQLWRINVNGSGEAAITVPGPNADEASDPAPSPDGARIAYTFTNGAAGFRGISVINVDGTGQAALTPSNGPNVDGAPDYSPDGKRIVFTRYDGVSDVVMAMGANGAGAAPLTTQPTPLTGDGDPVFSPEGTQIAFDRLDFGIGDSKILIAGSNGVDSGLRPLTSSTPPGLVEEPTWQPLNPPICTLGADIVTKSRARVSIPVSCTNENVRVVAQGSGKAPKAPHRPGARKATKFKIAPVTATVPAGTPTTVTLAIPKKGKKALKKAAKAGKKGKATITATFTDDLGLSATDSVAVKFKTKKKG